MQEIVRASHILLQFPPKASTDDSLIVLKMALKLKDDIQNGGNMNALALEHSDDPSAQVNQGDLGYFTALQMVQPFEDAAYSMQPGEVSDPVLTSFGYHIIKVQDRQANPGQVRVSHILVRIDDTNPNGEDAAKRKVADIYTEIQKESTIWEDIVEDYSEDPATSKSAGMLPWFSVGSMIPEFEMSAFGLTEIGEVSTPVRTRYGYHILRLEGKKPLESFESLEESIRSRILRDSRSSMIQSQVMAIQKARYNFVDNEAEIQKIRTALKDADVDAFQENIASEGLAGTQLFRLGQESYTVEDLLTFIEAEGMTLKSQSGLFDAWYERFAASKLNEAEEADLSTNNKEYKMLLNEYRDGILLFSLMNQEVWQKGLEDSVSQLGFYEKNIKNYQWNNRTEAMVVKVLQSEKLESARAMLSGKSYSQETIDTFESDFKNNNPLAFQLQSGTFEYENHPVLSQADLDKQYQEVTLEDDVYLVILGDQIPAGPKEFDETRGLVIRDFQEYLDKTLIETLREKYTVTVNPKTREEAFVSLNQ